MKRQKKDSTGRKAIEQLKSAYRTGFTFEGTPAIREMLIPALGLKPSMVTIGMARDWDRQARYELADVHISVTSPIPQAKYCRDPRPSPQVRHHSRVHRYNDVGTRIANLVRLAESDAAQANALPEEIRKAERLSIVLSLVDTFTDA